MAKYIDYIVLKTNKPNSKKTIEQFAEEFGYTDFLDETENARSLAIKFSADDLEYEIENFSKNLNKDTDKYGSDKITVEFYKTTRNQKSEKHLLKTMVFSAGECVENNENTVVKQLLEKETQKQKQKRQQTTQNKSTSNQQKPNQNSRNHSNSRPNNKSNNKNHHKGKKVNFQNKNESKSKEPNSEKPQQRKQQRRKQRP